MIFYVKSKLLISIFDLLIQFCINTHFVKSYSPTQPNVSPHDSTLYSEIFTDISQFPWVLGISINNHISIFFLKLLLWLAIALTWLDATSFLHIWIHTIVFCLCFLCIVYRKQLFFSMKLYFYSLCINYFCLILGKKLFSALNICI